MLVSRQPSYSVQYSMPLVPFLHRVSSGQDLTREQAREAMEAILDGLASPAQIGGFLIALHMKGESVHEVVGFAEAMRARVRPVHVELNGEPLLDTCGTGGDGLSTFNISTLAAFVAAGAGVRVAKHGNRSISSRCGSADLLEALGVAIALDPADTARAIREVGIGFLFAPLLHDAMKHAQPVRRDLKMRTVFNLLGPLTNPAGATVQLVGAPSESAAELMANALAALGLERGFVVHGAGGLDEIATTGETVVFQVGRGAVHRGRLHPRDFGVREAAPGELAGGDRERNRDIARDVLNGAPGAQRDIVLVNAAAALVAAGRVGDFREGMAVAAESVDSGAARAKVDELARFKTQ